MKLNFAAAMRRASRLTRAGRPVAATRAMQKAVSGAMVKSAIASLSRIPTMAIEKASTKKKRRKPAPQVRKTRVAPASPPKDRRLSAVVKQLRAVRAAMPSATMLTRPAKPSAPPTLPKGAQYLDKTHSCMAGARDFKLFLPARRPRGPKGLIVMLHGCSQDPNDFATGTNMNRVAQRHGLAVAYPAQTRRDNASSCWNWFVPASQARGAGEPAILASLTRDLMQELGLDQSQVFVAGLSAGGAMAAILAETYPDVFSAAGVHSGLPRGSANTLMSALSAMRNGGKPSSAAKPDSGMRRIIFHGDDDTTVHPSNAPQIVAGAVGARAPATVNQKSGMGRDYVRSQYVLPDGTVDVELWQIKGAGHAWSGGKARGSFTDPKGPDASAEMVRFFLTKTPKKPPLIYKALGLGSGGKGDPVAAGV